MGSIWVAAETRAGGAYAHATYGRLLGDAMEGDLLLFARQEAVEGEWRIVTPILTSGDPRP